MLRLAILFLCACTPDTTPEPTPPAPVEVTESGTCFERSALQSAPDVLFDWLVVAGYGTSEPTSAVLRSQAAVETFELETNLFISTARVDFSTQQILVGFVNVSSTCENEAFRMNVVEMEGAFHLLVEVSNPDGTCKTVCGMGWSVGIAIAVDNDQVGTACARRLDTCV